MITIILSTVLAIVGYFILMYLSVNFLGMVVRGFFKDEKIKELKDDSQTSDFIKKEATKVNRADTLVTIIAIIVLGIFLYLLYKYMNIWAVITVLLFMFSRIPDLLWEIKRGEKITKQNMPKGAIYSVTSIFTYLALPVLWYSIYLLIK